MCIAPEVGNSVGSSAVACMSLGCTLAYWLSTVIEYHLGLPCRTHRARVVVEMLSYVGDAP